MRIRPRGREGQFHESCVLVELQGLLGQRLRIITQTELHLQDPFIHRFEVFNDAWGKGLCRHTYRLLRIIDRVRQELPSDYRLGGA